MKSAYWKPVHISEWVDRLDDVATRAGTGRFSVVYRFYSTYDGPVRYVGRSDDPFSRAEEHCYQIGTDGIHEWLGGRVAWVDFCYFIGRERFRESYEEECRKYHHDEPDLNINHPAKLYQSYECPVC
jgi:hypothetical protein